MNVFPVYNSTLSPSHLAGYIQNLYFPDQQVECKILKTGINDTYLVKAGGAHAIFRVYSYQWRTRDEISEELRLLDHLKKGGIAVSFAVADVGNNYIQSLPAPEGERFAVLFSFAEGKKVLNFDAGTHFQVGSLMAHMHLLTQDFPLARVTYTAQELLTDPLARLAKFLPENTEEMRYMRSIQPYLIDELRRADAAQLRNGSIHLDLWFDNMNVAPDGRITFFDFDFCGNGWLCLDMAYYVLQIHATEPDEAARAHKTAEFLRGYESVCVISDEERRMLPILGICMYFFYLGIQCQRFDNWSNVFLNEIYLKRFINQLLKKYFDFHQLGPKNGGQH